MTHDRRQSSRIARTPAAQLRAADVGAAVVLLGWVHRVRDLGGLVFFDLRDRYGLTQVVVRAGSAAADSRRAASGRSSSSPSTGRSRRGRPRRSIRRSRPARSRSWRRARDPERGEDAAVSDQRRHGRVAKRRGCATAISICAGPALQQNLVLRHKVAIAARALLRRAGLPRDRDADSDAVDARRRARLPGAEPRASRRVLRAAAVAADLQADPDDRGHRSLLPDRAAASATRICAPIASPSSRRSTSRCRSRPRTLVYGVVEGAIQAMFARRRTRRSRRRSRASRTTTRC